MANTPRTMLRVDPSLIRDAADRAGLPERMPVSAIIRYALAVVAGHPDPRSVAESRPGPKPKQDAAA